ncbi:hypothetical protein L6452_10399 [Arctium lappa]|uniref:Uncharacterized protein n=1 Tax=Arctium lappa TaxID=4217 RepID=A0ACB9DN87_ARCLA|nr:hypothetical protein L6452_10399 [Arctium lappa]
MTYKASHSLQICCDLGIVLLYKWCWCTYCFLPSAHSDAYDSGGLDEGVAEPSADYLHDPWAEGRLWTAEINHAKYLLTLPQKDV